MVLVGDRLGIIVWEDEAHWLVRMDDGELRLVKKACQ